MIVTSQIASRSAAFALAALLLLLVPLSAQAQKAAPDPASTAAAKELMEVTGSAKMFDLVMQSMMGQMARAYGQQNPGRQDEIRDVFALMAKRASQRKQEVIDKIAAIYAEEFTAAELKEISAFYKSGVGAKFISKQGLITQKSMRIGQEWGMRLGREVEQEAREEMRKRGLKL
ncbi:MAG: DUF2059 domain-containing protein [Hyphomicrobiaceae bacterium]